MKTSNFNKVIKIQNRPVGDGQAVFVVAEAGVNHFGSVKKARDLVDLAVQAKADAFKIQVFKTDLLVSAESEEWRERLRPKELTYDEVIAIRDYCISRGIMFLATAHEEESLAFIETLDVPAYKIGSGEVNNLEFINAVAKRGRPIILSTGMYTLDEVGRSLEIIAAADNRDVIVLHCVTLYPAPPEQINLKAMDLIRKEFDVLVGYSDHTVGYEVPLAAVGRGACMVEKHITIDRDVPNAQDWKVSCGPEDFAKMVASVHLVSSAIGTGIKAPGEAELNSKKWARKSLAAKVDIHAGSIVDKTMLCSKRPGIGISPDEIDKLVGMCASVDIKEDSVITWGMLKR